MTKFLSYVFLISISVALGILVSIYGWGLHPQSWGWIIGGGLFGQVIVRAFISAIEKEDTKK